MFSQREEYSQVVLNNELCRVSNSLFFLYIYIYNKWMFCIYMETSFPLSEWNCSDYRAATFRSWKHFTGWEADPLSSSVRHLSPGLSNMVICQRWKLKWRFFWGVLHKFMGPIKNKAEEKKISFLFIQQNKKNKKNWDYSSGSHSKWKRKTYIWK